MQNPGDDKEVAALERSQVYTVSGDAELMKNFKDPLIGQVLEDKYRIEQVIGWGGMSVVYKARHVLVDRVVAIKTIKFRADERPDIWQRFQREIVTLSRLSHENVVTVYDCVVGKDGQPYVVMDLVQGSTLDDLLGERGRLPMEEVVSIGGQVASAVDHAHRHNVIHRDLKPANIMIIDNELAASDHPEVKVVDFGLAKLGEDTQRLTQTGQLWGSPPYISPEQIKGGNVDHRADIYSLGIVLYEMATGRDPFASEVVYEMLHRHVHADPPPFSEVCPNDPPPRELETVIRRAIAKDPNARYQTMGELRDDLERAQAVAENRLAAEGAKTSRATTGRLNSVATPRVSNLRKSTEPLPHLRHVSQANLLYIALTLILVGAGVTLALKGTSAIWHGQASNSPAEAASAPKSSPHGAAEAHESQHPALLTTRHISHQDQSGSPAEHPPGEPSSQAGSVQSGQTAKKLGAAGLLEHTHHAGDAAHSRHPGASEHPHHLHPLVSPAGPPNPSSEPNSHAISSTVKKSLPNASQLHVDQSKFQLLRDLKSPVLRQECGDLPQH